MSRSFALSGLASMALIAGCAFASGSGDAPAPGDLAPDVSMKGSDGKEYRLSDFRGKQAVVIAWFPKAFTGG